MQTVVRVYNGPVFLGGQAHPNENKWRQKALPPRMHLGCIRGGTFIAGEKGQRFLRSSQDRLRLTVTMTCIVPSKTVGSYERPAIGSCHNQNALVVETTAANPEVKNLTALGTGKPAVLVLGTPVRPSRKRFGSPSAKPKGNQKVLENVLRFVLVDV